MNDTPFEYLKNQDARLVPKETEAELNNKESYLNGLIEMAETEDLNCPETAVCPYYPDGCLGIIKTQQYDQYCVLGLKSAIEDDDNE